VSDESTNTIPGPVSRSGSGSWAAACAVVVCGKSVAEFLQGYLTCDTADLTADTPRAMALCNVQGRVVACGWALMLNDHLQHDTGQAIALIVHASLASRVREFLKPYLMFSKCTFDESPYDVQVVCSNAAAFPIKKITIAPAADSESADRQDQSQTCQQLLVAAGFVFLEEPVSERFLPQVLGLDVFDAIDFNKGCYLGQEIIARSQFRGTFKRKLQLNFWHTQPPLVGSKWSPAGTVIAVSAAGQLLAVVPV